MPRNYSSILYAFWKKPSWQSFSFLTTRYFYPKTMVWKQCICPYINPSLSIIWHVNCVWFFEKGSWQSFGSNKPFFIKIVIFYYKWLIHDIFVLVSSSPKYILTHAKIQRFYLACFLKNTIIFYLKKKKTTF